MSHQAIQPFPSEAYPDAHPEDLLYGYVVVPWKKLKNLYISRATVRAFVEYEARKMVDDLMREYDRLADV